MRLEYFEMVDRILDLSIEAGTVRAAATVPMQSPIFEGHFPGHPIMPGVLLIETMAQTAGWIILATLRLERMPFLIGVDGAKLRTFVAPGTPLEVSATIAHEGSGYTVTRADVSTGGRRICDAELKFRILPFPSPDVRAMLCEAAQRVKLPIEVVGHAG